MVVLVLTFVKGISFATLVSKPMVFTMEKLKVLASTIKTYMTAKVPQDFAMIVIQNAEEELGQLLLKLLALKRMSKKEYYGSFALFQLF